MNRWQPVHLCVYERMFTGERIHNIVGGHTLGIPAVAVYGRTHRMPTCYCEPSRLSVQILLPRFGSVQVCIPVPCPRSTVRCRGHSYARFARTVRRRSQNLTPPTNIRLPHFHHNDNRQPRLRTTARFPLTEARLS